MVNKGMRIIEYSVACGESASDLQIEVNYFLKQGWSIQGSVAMCPSALSTVDVVFSQAMVLRGIDDA